MANVSHLPNFNQSVSRPICLSVNPHLGCQKVAVLSMWGALSGKRTGSSCLEVEVAVAVDFATDGQPTSFSFGGP
jgi:hypothetical protein